MPIRSVEFLQMPASQSSGEYPLLTSSSQSLASYTVSTQRCRVTDDLRQMIRTAAFTGWSDCNMIRMNGWLYWVLEANTSTDSQASVEFVVSYCGPSSVLHKGDSVVGCFSRLPTNKCTWLKREPKSGPSEHTRTIELPNLGLQLGYKLYWAQVTYQNTDTTTDTVVTKRAGFFVGYGGEELDYSVRCNIGLSSPGMYPSIQDLLSNVADILGTTASSVLDVSVSERCPYKTIVTTATASCINLEVSGAAVIPTSPSGTTKYVYDLDSVSDEGPFEQWTESKTITLSTLEQGCGTVTVRDSSGASVAEIPARYGSPLTMSVTCISDLTGVSTVIESGGYLITLPEGHLPWNGTAWEEYRAYSMSYDRQAMENTIDFTSQRQSVALAQSAASSIQSAATGFIGGDPLGAVAGAVGGAASFAISAYATAEDTRISTAEARATQALAERRAEGQPSTPYNPGYGLAYIIRGYLYPSSIWVEMPAGLTESIDSDYTACFGYPAEGLRSINVQEGYIKGRIYDNGLARGPRFDRMNETLQNGILFKEV